jgi:hypothetical protein
MYIAGTVDSKKKERNIFTCYIEEKCLKFRVSLQVPVFSSGTQDWGFTDIYWKCHRLSNFE